MLRRVRMLISTRSAVFLAEQFGLLSTFASAETRAASPNIQTTYSQPVPLSDDAADTG